MVPNGLKEIIDDSDFIEIGIRILILDVEGDSLRVEVAVSDDEGSGDVFKILMTVTGVKDYFLHRYDHSGYISFESDHPLLWRFSDTQCDLYISGLTHQPDELFFNLYETHFSHFGNYLSFDPRKMNIIKGGRGLFDRGPLKLLNIYAEIFHKYGVESSIIGSVPPEKRASELRILFLGNSYFIGEDFQFSRI